MVLKLYHPWPFLNFCDHIRIHSTEMWGNFILSIAQTVFLLLFNFILHYILWPPHDHWVLKYHTLTNTALLFNFILHYILWAPHDHWVLKYHTLTNTALLFNFILHYILWGLSAQISNQTFASKHLKCLESKDHQIIALKQQTTFGTLVSKRVKVSLYRSALIVTFSGNDDWAQYTAVHNMHKRSTICTSVDI